jgi:hypothetical protein
LHPFSVPDFAFEVLDSRALARGIIEDALPRLEAALRRALA